MARKECLEQVSFVYITEVEPNKVAFLRSNSDVAKHAKFVRICYNFVSITSHNLYKDN